MTIRNLEYLFGPTSVAVIGASERPHSVGYTVMRSLLNSGLSGPVMPVNPKYNAVAGVLALDARIRVAPSISCGTQRLAIRPYPQELEQSVAFNGWRLLLRPIRSEDEPQHRRFLSQLEPEDIHFRFLDGPREFSHSEIARFTQIDYDCEMAFIATMEGEEGRPRTLGLPDKTSCKPHGVCS